jgi:hypothetical protein
MKHHLHAAQRPLDQRQVVQVPLDELDLPQAGRQVREFPRAQVVQHADLVPATDERFGDVGTDEARAAGHQAETF